MLTQNFNCILCSNFLFCPNWRKKINKNCTCCEAYRLIVGLTPLILYCSVRWKWLVSFMLQPLYPTEKSTGTGTHWVGGWMLYNKRKSHVPARTQTSDYPTRSLHTMSTMLSCLQTLWTGLVYLFIYYKLDLEQLSQYSNSLECGKFGVQTPAGARFFTPFQTGPKAHPASPTIGIPALSQGQSSHSVVLTSCSHLV